MFSINGPIPHRFASQWYPLNGGSDTRKAVREQHREFALSYKLEYARQGGSSVLIGTPRKTGRGYRYMSYSNEALGWVQYRKAKRLERRGTAQIVGGIRQQ